MRLRQLFFPVGTIALVAALLAVSTATAFASPSPQDGERRGVFGEVVQVGEDAIVVSVGNDTLQIQLSPDTRFAVRGKGKGNPDVQPGDRVAVMVVKQNDTLVAEAVMVVPRKVAVVHIMGVVGQAADDGVTIITDKGQHLIIKLSSNKPVPEPGTVVTVVGHKNPLTGIIKARSFHQLNQTLQRLSNHLDQIEEGVPNDQAQVPHLTRIRHLIEKASQRQVEVLSNVIDKLPEEARPALERAVRNLQEANQAVLRAFSQALGKVQRTAGPRRDEQRQPRSLDEVRPTLADIAHALGISASDLKDLLRQGNTLAHIAQKMGLTEEALLKGVLAQVGQRVKRLAERGRLDPQQVESILQKIREEVKARLQQLPDTGDLDGERRLPPGVPFSAQDLAEILGMEPSDLSAGIHQGKSLLQIAEEHGLTPEQLKEAIMKLVRERARTLMDRGHLTAEEAQRLLEQFREEMLERIAKASPSDQRQSPAPGLPVTPEDMARILGMPVKELLRHFEEGGTLQQLARRQGATVEALIEKMMGLARQRLASLVEEGQLSREEMQRRLEQMKQKIHEQLARIPERRIATAVAVPALPSNVPFNLIQAARALGLSPDELHNLLSQGSSLEEVAKKRNINLDKLINALLAPVEKRLRHLLGAERISEEQAKRMLNKMRQGILRAIREFRLPEYRKPGPDSATPRAFPSFILASNLSITRGDVARVLGMELAELQRRFEAGESLLSLLHSRDLTVEKFVQALLDVARQRLSEAAERRDLNREQIEKILGGLKQRILDELRARAAGSGPSEPPDEEGKPPAEDVDSPSPDLGSPVLPPISSAQDLFQALGIDPERVRQLHGEGLTIAEVARKLGLGPSNTLEHLMVMAKKRLVVAVQAGRLSEEEAEKLLHHFQEQVKKLLSALFAAPPASGDASPETQTEGVSSDADTATNTTEESPPADATSEGDTTSASGDGTTSDTGTSDSDTATESPDNATETTAEGDQQTSGTTEETEEEPAPSAASTG